MKETRKRLRRRKRIEMSKMKGFPPSASPAVFKELLLSIDFDNNDRRHEYIDKLHKFYITGLHRVRDYFIRYYEIKTDYRHLEIDKYFLFRDSLRDVSKMYEISNVQLYILFYVRAINIKTGLPATHMSIRNEVSRLNSFYYRRDDTMMLLNKKLLSCKSAKTKKRAKDGSYYIGSIKGYIVSGAGNKYIDEINNRVKHYFIT